ncbi:helicase SEN1-like [Prunus yedoensis var. nudiflora]|uniref:Helicase SEN1-like n=1 Tax=Prunus yedoensis var. nudiflora TaxID=2094558 RepID=A0A314YUL5_PRUYE|nr:helicase SEN1-like [Prunus yedoensis var. nudiflora]
MDHEDSEVKKPFEIAGRSLIDLVFSWSLRNVLFRDLYKHQVTKIPETFSTVAGYMKSFIPSLIEETHADLLSNVTAISQAPICEILTVETSKHHRPPKDLFYEITVRKMIATESNAGKYEPAVGDIFALTNIRPKCIDDLNRPTNFYLIAYVLGSKDESSDNLQILSSKPINGEGYKQIKSKKETLFAVYLMNMTTNVRVWKALNSEKTNTNIIKNVLQVQPSSSDGENSCTTCFSKHMCFPDLSTKWPTMCSDLNDSQKAAVLNCISLSKCHHHNAVKLIWGPPGTGKTKTVGTTLFVLFKLKCRTLTCAPTNIAVLEVTARLLRLVNQTLEYGKYGLGDIILFGNLERMNIDNYNDLFEVFLDSRISILSKCLAPLSGWKHWLESMIGLLDDPEQLYSLYLKEKREQHRKSDEHDEETDNSSSTSDDEIDLLTFEEFVKKKFDYISEHLKTCMVWFAKEFRNSIAEIKTPEIRQDVISLIQKLSNGWRQSQNDKVIIGRGGTSAELLETYEVNELLYLFWSVEIHKQDSYFVQVMKIWDIVPLSDIPKLTERLDIIFGNYTVDKMNRCKHRCFDGVNVVPNRWPADSSSCNEADPTEFLSKPFSSLSLRDRPSSSSSFRNNFMSRMSGTKGTGSRPRCVCSSSSSSRRRQGLSAVCWKVVAIANLPVM